jgi:hypothetical protein
MDIERLLFSAQLDTAPSRSLSLPWESGFADVIFGRRGPLPVFQPVPELTDPVPMIARASEIVNGLIDDLCHGFSYYWHSLGVWKL